MRHKRKVAVAVLAGAVIAISAAFWLGCATGRHLQFVVADEGNNRVLLYMRSVTTNQAAEAVLGQPDAMSNASNNGGTSASTMFSPNAVAKGTSQQLLVADTNNCRVLSFEPPFSTGMAATTIFGQPDGTSRGCSASDAPTATDLRNPHGVAMDSQGNLWVADYLNHRVLKYEPPFSTGMAASVALGQTATSGGSYGCNMASGGAVPPASAGTLCYPSNLAVDSSDNLWIVEYGNNRVVMYPPAEQVQGGVATHVLGQQDFTAKVFGTTASTLNGVWDAAVAPDGNLWVSDADNHRVLAYMPPFSNGMNASVALGQVDFVSSSSGTSKTKFTAPQGVGVDSSGNLAVTDLNNHRTLIFPPSELTTGGSASVVLGQSNFTSGNSNQGGAVSAVTQSSPVGVAAYW